MAYSNYGNKNMPMHDNGNDFGEKSRGNGRGVNGDTRNNFGRRGRDTDMNGNLPMMPHNPFTGEPTVMPMRKIEISVIKKG